MVFNPTEKFIYTISVELNEHKLFLSLFFRSLTPITNNNYISSLFWMKKQKITSEIWCPEVIGIYILTIIWIFLNLTIRVKFWNTCINLPVIAYIKKIYCYNLSYNLILLVRSEFNSHNPFLTRIEILIESEFQIFKTAQFT